MPPGVWSSQRHWHREEDEFVFVVSGEVTITTEEGETTLGPLDSCRLVPGETRAIVNNTNLPALMLVAIAENGRIPIDNPSTHLELTMVHEAMVLEYSGRHLAMLELAAQLKLLLYFSLIGCVFVPFGLAAPESPTGGYAIGIVAYAVKLAAGGALLALFETTTAKMRVFRVPNFLGAALMLGLLGTLLLFASRSL